VLRLDIYLGERDSLGIGFSDNVIYHRQLYVRALLAEPVRFELHRDESFDYIDNPSSAGQEMQRGESGWTFGLTDPPSTPPSASRSSPCPKPATRSRSDRARHFDDRRGRAGAGTLQPRVLRRGAKSRLGVRESAFRPSGRARSMRTR
jgi:hypothetical protein